MELSKNIGDDGIKLLLDAWKNGDYSARDKLFYHLYDELNRLSAILIHHEHRLSLSVGDLVSEASMRLMKIHSTDWQHKSHFMALAAKMMRRVIIDHVRKRDAQKRQHHRVTMITGLFEDKILTNYLGVEAKTIDIIALDKALAQLHELDTSKADIVEMRYYGGMSIEEIAQVMSTSPSTVKRSWRAARAWLLGALEK